MSNLISSCLNRNEAMTARYIVGTVVVEAAAITMLVMGILAVLAASGHPMGSVIGSLQMGGGIGLIVAGAVVTALVLALLARKIACGESTHKVKTRSGPEVVIPKEGNIAQAAKADAVFTRPRFNGWVVDEPTFNEIAQDLSGLVEGVSHLPKKEPTKAQGEKHGAIKAQLVTNFKVQKDGQAWGFDTVLMRGVRLPDPGHTKLDTVHTNMTTIIAETFAQGMHPNGYLHKKEGSTYHEELVINTSHNWLVSTSFALDVACRYAAQDVGKTGIVFFIHASQENMQKHLYGVNLSGRGLIASAEREVGFVFVPPEAIIGAVPVTFHGQGMGQSFSLHKDCFIPNPHFSGPQVEEIAELGDLGLKEPVLNAVTTGLCAVSMSYYEPLCSPHYKQAQGQDCPE